MRPNLRDQSGMTLIELVVVLMVVGILLGIAVSSFLGHRERAEDAVAKTAIRASLPAVIAYGQDHSGYMGMNSTELAAIAPGSGNVEVLSATADAFCLRSTKGSRTWYLAGPDGQISQAPCS